MLRGDNVFLRVVDKTDDTTLFFWENDTENWKISNTEIPYSLHSIHQLIEQQNDLRVSGQLRFMICENTSSNPIGNIDLYDVNFKHGYATVGILIADKTKRKQGLAKESLTILIEYCKQILELRNLQCFIHEDNTDSVSLFENVGFRHVGTLKKWLKFSGHIYDLHHYQLAL